MEKLFIQVIRQVLLIILPVKTVEVDLKGKTMLPGFIDPHGHFMSAVLMVTQVNVASPPMGTVTDIPSMIKKLQDFKKEQKVKDGEWIVGWGYDQDLLKEKRHITKLDLDKAFPNNKVLIIHISMHGGVLNSKALEWAGLDENSKTPEGGVIARLPGGNEPAGLLMEMAYMPVFDKLTTTFRRCNDGSDEGSSNAIYQ